MKKLLTISIPTWNRVDLLTELLFQLIDQIKSFSIEHEVQILISENASEDNTWEVISKIKANHSFISINRNSSNIGAKSNVLKSMELADAEYVLFLGDDDRIRDNCLIDVITLLKKNKEIGILIDISKFKLKQNLKEGFYDLDIFLENLFWYIGNAGLFISKTDFFKQKLKDYGYDFFNECWPQTQIMILGLSDSNLKPFVADINIPIGSKHDDVMVYSSYYIWRTCVLELHHSLNAIKHIISESTYHSSRTFLNHAVKQNFLNILQCGVFVDDTRTKRLTINSILNNLNMLTTKERIYFSIAMAVLFLPEIIGKLFSNIFIFITRGKSGLVKKDNFVKNEQAKKSRIKLNDKSVRSLTFEN